jgi:hypothetical protein
VSGFDREHRQVQAALGALAGPDRDALLAHVHTCDECARSLAGVQDALLAVLYLPPPRPLEARRSEEVRGRLLGRVAGAGPSPFPVAAESRRRRLARFGPASGWVAAAGFAALLLTHHAFHQPLQFGWVVAAALGTGLSGTAVYLLTERRRTALLRERLAALELELARIRTHALGGERVFGTA